MECARDVITLRGLSAVGNHGVYDFERSGSQVFSADITLHVDSHLAAQTDSVEHTVDYSQIAEEAVQILTGPPVYLIETLVSNLAEMALKNPLVFSVTVTVHKPMAPVHHKFSDVSVTMTRTREDYQAAASQVVEGERTNLGVPRDEGSLSSQKVILALGSNQGDSRQILCRAVAALMDIAGLEIDNVSPLVVTKPVLHEDQPAQPDYFNAVVEARTVVQPEDLLAATQQVEEQFGRVRVGQWEPRTLDIDLISWGDLVFDTRELILPHPRANQRAFVLYPWALMDPQAQLDGRRVVELAEKAADRSGILDVIDDWLDENALETRAVDSVKDDPTGPAFEPELGAPAESGQPEVLRLPPPPPRPEIEIRGNKVALDAVGGDAIFQALLEQEQSIDSKVEGRQKQSSVDQLVAPVFAKRRDLHYRLSVEPTVDEEAVEPSETTDGDGTQLLPDWRFSSAQQEVRIVDSPEDDDKTEFFPRRSIDKWA